MALTSLGTLGAYFVAAVTSSSPQPWWPYVFLTCLMILGAVLYLVGQRGARTPPEPPSIEAATDEVIAQAQAVALPPAPNSQPAMAVAIRLMPELDVATNRLRLGALNRGAFGRFRVQVIDAHNQDGNWVGPRSWPVPWLEDGSTGSRETPTFGKPMLDFAHFDYLGLQEDLEGTKWLRGNHWVFPSLPEPVAFRYSAVRAWPDLQRQYIVVTLRVLRDEPEGHVDKQIKIGLKEGTEPYCVELTGQPAAGVSSPPDPQQLPDLLGDGAVEQPELAPEPESPPEGGRAVADRWRHTGDGAKVPALMRLTQTGFFHPGYMGRKTEDVPPSVKLGMLVACGPIDSSSSGTELRGQFAAFLGSDSVCEVVAALTSVPPGASWKNLAGHGPRTLEAALTAKDNPMEGVPVASALFLPPTAGEALYGRDGRSATLVLYIEPRTADGQVPPPSNLEVWRRRLSLSMGLTGAFADFLDKDLGLGALDDPRSQFGVWLQSHRLLTAMVDVGGLRVLPGASVSTEFIGWAYADPDGNSIAATTRDLLTQLCEYTLHLDGFDHALAAMQDEADVCLWDRITCNRCNDYKKEGRVWGSTLTALAGNTTWNSRRSRPGDRRIRLAVANGEPAFEDSREYTSITGNPLLCPLDSGEWALVASESTTQFKADGGADAVDRAKRILVDNE